MPEDTRSSGKRFGLGRGLGALIVNTETDRLTEQKAAEQGAAGGIRLVPVDAIRPNPQQPRSQFDPSALEELAASIREHGILQPLIVTDSGDQPGQYWLITGERRWRAAQLAQLDEVPAIVREASPQQLLEWALVENVQRADLNPLEEAAAYQMLLENFSLTQEEIGRRVGRSRSAVANTVRLLQLPAEVQHAVIEGSITAGHARALLALPDAAVMSDALKRILARGLSVRQTEELVKRLLTAPEPAAETEPEPDPHLQFLEGRFRSALGTRVTLNRSANGSGRLIVHFYSDDDLDNLYRLIAADADDELG
jgi:ParB family chromosome partitioning protein